MFKLGTFKKNVILNCPDFHTKRFADTLLPIDSFMSVYAV